MATEIEKTFFDTFGIKTKYIYYIKDTSTKLCYYSATKKDILDYFTNKNHRKYKVFNVKIEHPQITDRILLGLVVVMTRYTDIIEGFDSIDELKNFVLTDLMYSLTQSEADIVKHQVHKLFEEV